MPLFGELSRSSQDLFESESDSNKPRDEWLDLPKSGILLFFAIFSDIEWIESIEWIEGRYDPGRIDRIDRIDPQLRYLKPVRTYVSKARTYVRI